MNKAKNLFETHQIQEALETLNDLIAREPSPELLQEAYFLLAAALRMNNQDRQAALTLEQFLEEFPISPLANEVRLMLGELHTVLGEPKQALAVLKEVLSLAPDPATRQDALRQIREIHISRGDFLPGIQTALEEMPLVRHPEVSALKSVIREVILQKMNEPTLEALLEAYPRTYPGDLAMIRLIELHTARGDEVLAERDIRSFVKRFPNHLYAPTAMALLQSFMAKIRANTHVIAALLPFSGPMKPFGTDALNGIRMAIEEGKDRMDLSSIGLVVKDTSSLFSPFRYELSQLITEFNPIGVIGPLSSQEIKSVANLPDQYQIPFFTPSATLADIRRFGSFWFSTALTSSLQIKRLIEYVVTQFEYRRFCIIYPETAYGREFSRLFAREAEGFEAEIIAIESYSEDTTDMAPQIRRIKGKDLMRYGTSEIERTATDHPRTIYTPGFDAVFIPGRPVHVALIGAQLEFYDIKVPLLGGNSWHSPELLQWAQHGVEEGIFADGFFLESSDPSIREFAQRYRIRFGQEPSLFAVQAYDAARLMLDAIQNGARSGSEIREQLSRRHDLPALSGLAAFGSNGILDRKVYIIRVTKEGFVQIH